MVTKISRHQPDEQEEAPVRRRDTGTMMKIKMTSAT